MGGTLLAALAALLLGPLAPPPALVESLRERGFSARAWFAKAEPGFRPAARAVDNWRFEAADFLDVDGAGLLAFALLAPESLPRCIRLNNYWCVKRAGWAGEIAADAEGHVAFASAHDGATVAALLLRRYYVDYGRKDARTIVANWAPAQCGPVVTVARGRRVAAADGLTTRGIRNTLRAKYLASRSGKGKRAVSRIAARPVQMMRAPAIAAGLGETPPASAAIRLASLEPGRRASDASPAPLRSCPDETRRMANYAARMVDGLAKDGAALAPGDDLALFDAAGEPTDTLAKVMLNMAAVEIGPWRVTQALVEQGIAGMRDTIRRRAEAARPAQP